MKKNILILGLALTLPAMSAFAAAPRGKGGPGGPPHPAPNQEGDHPGEVHDDAHRNPIFHALLHALDVNDDGTISMTEMNHADEELLKLDRNGDGKLSNAELVSPENPKDCPPGQKPDKGDKPVQNKDPQKTPGDKDGAKGDKGDNQSPATDDDKKPAKGPKSDKDNDSDRGPKGGNQSPKKDEHLSALVDAIDTNHDGEISAEEIAAARVNLKKLDLNHDGKLTTSEYAKHAHE